MSQFSKSGQFNKSGTFLVKPHNPRRAWTQRIFVLLILIGSCWGTYKYGLQHGGYMKTSTDALIDSQSEQMVMLNARIDELLLENAQLASNMTIDATANQQVSERLRELNEEILELKEELVFYRSLLTPADLEPGIQILGIQMAKSPHQEPVTNEDDEEPLIGDTYSYKIVLAQRRRTQFASGNMDLQLTGLREGRQTTLYAADVMRDSKDVLSFKFKNFQSLEGRLVLPKDFEPKNMLVSVMPKERGLKQVERSFEWNAIVSGG